jgi:hypothetical protein
MATFSSRGPLFGDVARFFPDLTGNGVSTVMALFGNELSAWVANGTSMAAPQVAGAAGLVRAARPGTNARELKALLLCHTEDMTAGRNSCGLGYLRDDLACEQARLPGRVVSATIGSTTTPKTHALTVTANQPYRVCLVWHRHVMTSAAWSNLGLRVLNGTTVVASSNDPRNLYEKVTFTAPITGNLTVEVSATSLEVASLPYSLAANAPLGGGPGTPATYTTFGHGCSGTPGPCTTVPAYAASSFGNIGQISPLTFGICRYQQVFPGGHLPAAFTMTGLSLRQDDQSGAGSPGGVVDVEFQLGLTTRTPADITGSFANNFDSGAPVTVLSRSRILLPNQPANPPTDPRVFLVNIPFTTPFPWPAAGGGRNLLIDITVRAAQIHYYPGDATSLGSTTQVIGFPDTAPTGTVYRNVGAIMCFRSPATMVPLLGSAGTPRIGGSFAVDLTQARANTAAFLFLGLSDQRWLGQPLPLDLGPAGAPGCFIWCSGELIHSVATNAAGAASFNYSVPNDRSLLGGVFFNDYVVHDPPANALQFVTTRGGRGRFGDQ